MSAEESGGNPVRLDELIAVRCAVITRSSGTGEKHQRDKKKTVSLMS